jgi:hypothetical protein
MPILSASQQAGHFLTPVDAREALSKTHGAATVLVQSIRHFHRDASFFGIWSREKSTKIINGHGVFII